MIAVEHTFGDPLGFPRVTVRVHADGRTDFALRLAQPSEHVLTEGEFHVLRGLVLQSIRGAVERRPAMLAEAKRRRLERTRTVEGTT